jgi:hypothetical protein
MAGTLRPANYVLRVAGSGLTAYELSVRPKLAVIKADIFEPNDSFDSATRLLFDPPSPFSIFVSGAGRLRRHVASALDSRDWLSRGE